jgi:hypothetical protein
MSDAEKPTEGELILYQTQEGTVRIEVLYESETFWLNQKKIAELFGVDIRTIREHFRNIFASGELDEQSVLRKIRTTAADGKNYLIEQEIKELGRVVTMYLDYAENQASRQIPMRMADWVARLDAFLKFNEYEVLTSAGSGSAEVAKRLAEGQYAAFRVQQDRRFESDFEREIKRIEGHQQPKEESE